MFLWYSGSMGDQMKHLERFSCIPCWRAASEFNIVKKWARAMYFVIQWKNGSTVPGMACAQEPFERRIVAGCVRLV